MGIKLTGTSQALEQQRTREEEAKKTRFNQLDQIADLKLRQQAQANQEEENRIQRERERRLDERQAEQDRIAKDQGILTRHRDIMSTYERGTYHELTLEEAAAYTRMYGRNVVGVRRDQHGYNFVSPKATPEGFAGPAEMESRFLLSDSADLAEQVDLPRGYKALYSVVPGEQYWGDDVVGEVHGPKQWFGVLDPQGKFVKLKDFQNPGNQQYASVLEDIKTKGIPESRQSGNVTEREQLDRQEHNQVATELAWDIAALWAKQKGGGAPPAVVNAVVWDLPSARTALSRLDMDYRDLEALRQTINDPDTQPRDKTAAERKYTKLGGDKQWQQLANDRKALLTYVTNEGELQRMTPQWERQLKNSNNPAKLYLDLLEKNGLTEE